MLILCMNYLVFSFQLQLFVTHFQVNFFFVFHLHITTHFCQETHPATPLKALNQNATAYNVRQLHKKTLMFTPCGVGLVEGLVLVC